MSRDCDPVNQLKQYNLVYVASPYSLFPHGLEEAWADASAITADLTELGIHAFSPIAHSHSLAVCGAMDPHDAALWAPLNEVMMSFADALVVAKLEGWEESKGVGEEIARFKGEGKPIYYVNPDTMEWSWAKILGG